MSGRTLTEQLQAIANEYKNAGEPWPASARQIAAWAIRTKRWAPQSSSLVTQCANQLAGAMGQEYFLDPQGRVVRAKHAARMAGQDGEQGVLWDDIRTADRRHMEVAFQNRREHIIGECRQLKADVDSFNENRFPGAPIQLVLNFSEDVAELEAVAQFRRVSASYGSIARVLPWRPSPSVLQP